MKFNAIYVDPPWPLKLISRHVRPKQLEFPYKVMSIDDITNLPIIDLVDEQCHLFLWATQKYLPHAFNIMETWGFKYHCTFNWDKTYGFCPMSYMWSNEFCLYGQIPGKWQKLNRLGIKTSFIEKPREHSRKPDRMYEVIEESVSGPYLELFARYKRENWTQIGYELDGLDILESIKETKCL